MFHESRRAAPSNLAFPKIYPAHPGLRRKKYERGFSALMSRWRKLKFCFAQDDDAAPLRRSSRERQFGRHPPTSSSVTCAQAETRTPAGFPECRRLVEQQNIDIPAGLGPRRPDRCNDMACIIRLMPATPMADSSPPIVVGMAYQQGTSP